MNRNAILLATCLFLTGFAGCTDDTPTPTTSSSPAAADNCTNVTRTGLSLSNSNHSVVAISTDKGCIVVELYDSKTPITVANFKKLVGDGFYTDLLFHRIIKGFMVQTGGMQKDGEFKESPYPAIKNEARTSGLKNLKYTLSMARQGGTASNNYGADTATNQFFINAANNANLDPGGSQSPGYAVFGIVLGGRDVVDQIENTPTTAYNAPGANPHCQPEQGSASCPKTDIVLRSVKLV